MFNNPENSAARQNMIMLSSQATKEPNYEHAKQKGLQAIAWAIVYLADVMYKNGRHKED